VTLYAYDHCPYCVKVRMIFGLKQIAFNLVTLANDDEETPIRMIGKKMVPILEKSKNEFMPESLDIIKYVDALSDFGKPIVNESKDSKELTQWLKDSKNYHYFLAMPRWIQMGLDEFKTQSAIDYFSKKKELKIGSFAAALLRSPHFIAMANSHLQFLEELISSKKYFWSDQLSIDDFHVFATLRVLTATKAVVFPTNINSYMNRMSELAKIPLHWDKAI
jgi:glutaredoxin 2